MHKHLVKNVLDSGGLKFLIVEDEPISQAILIKILLHITKASFYRAHNLAEAREILKDTSVHLIFMDHFLQGGDDAYNLIEEMRDSNDTTPIIVISADDETEHVKTALDLGANDFIVKPLKAKVIKRSVENIIKLA